jgi:hypothetical protein
MKRLIMLFAFFNALLSSYAQVEETNINITEQQLENITENNEDIETEDDSYLQLLRQLLKNPVNINEADADELRELRLLSPIQIQQFLSYRTLVGKLIDMYELQAIPGWDVQTIRKIKPYITVSLQANVLTAVINRFNHREHSLLIRTSQILEKSKGYLLDSSVATNFYPGSPQRLLLRYKYTYKNLLQFGVVAEKDAGEQFFKGSQKQGFDFYSFHLFIRKAGIIRLLAVGDFSVNMGQGLTQWQSLAFKKNAEITNTKREGDILRPYNSAAEINFHRGLGISLGKGRWRLTAFSSYRKIDANFVSDTLQSQDDFVSSFQTSGYHRTKSETDDKGVQQQLAFGGNLSYRNKKFHFGVNGIYYRFKFPLIKSADPYNAYALSGKNFGNYSFDYSYTFKNIHFFGEAAFTSSFSKAFVNGIIASVSSVADLSLLYRNISRSYQSLYTSAFTESTYPTNERGFYAGLSIRPAMFFRIDMYADVYKFPWLKYRVDAPSNGSDYLFQLTYKPNRQLEIYSRFRFESKAINVNPGNLQISSVMQQPRKNWRTQVSYRVNSKIVIRNRTEIVWFDKKGMSAEQGFLSFFDFLYKPPLKPLSANLRLQYFETDGYNSRLYAYENDVLYSYSVPVYYDKGFRYYININYDFGKKLSAWVRWAQIIYRDRTLIGSGLDEIQGNRKSEFKLQALYRF